MGFTIWEGVAEGDKIKNVPISMWSKGQEIRCKLRVTHSFLGTNQFTQGMYR